MISALFLIPAVAIGILIGMFFAAMLQASDGGEK